jgi:hypothetical protein
MIDEARGQLSTRQGLILKDAQFLIMADAYTTLLILVIRIPSSWSAQFNLYS